MNKIKKQNISSTIVVVLLFIIAIIGYLFINQQSKRQLAELEKEVQVVASPTLEPKPVAKEMSALEPRTLRLPSHFYVGQNSTLYLTTDIKTVNRDQKFNLDVWLDAQGEEVDGVEFVLTFNPQLVQVDEPIQGNFFSLYPQMQVDNNSGQIKIVALHKTDESKKLFEELVVTIPVTAVKAGIINFSFVLDKTLVAGYGDQDLLKTASPISVILR